MGGFFSGIKGVIYMERNHSVPEEILKNILEYPSNRGARKLVWIAYVQYGHISSLNRRLIQETASIRKHKSRQKPISNINERLLEEITKASNSSWGQDKGRNAI